MVEKAGVSSVCIKFDTFTVVQAFRRKNEDDRSYFGSIILDHLVIVKDLSPTVFILLGDQRI